MDKKKLSLKEIGLPRLLILLFAGVILIFLSLSEAASGQKGQKDSKDETTKEVTVKEEKNRGLSEYEKRLTEVLSKVEGVGHVVSSYPLPSSCIVICICCASKL